MNALLLGFLSLTIAISNAVATEQSRFQCELTTNLNRTQGVYIIYDWKNSIKHVLSLAGEPTFLIYNTTPGVRSLNFTWNNKTGMIENVSLSNYGSLYGFVIRNIVEFKVAGANINFDLQNFDKVNASSNSTLFKTLPLSNLKYNLTELDSECNKTGRILVSLQQKNTTNSTTQTQLNLVFDVQAQVGEGRLSSQPKYSFRGNNSIIDLIITEFPFNLTNDDSPSSRLALELDFIKDNGSHLFYSSEKNIDDEYTPAVFLQNTIQPLEHPQYFYWKPISYAAASRNVESSMIVTYLNGTVTPHTDLNTTGFFPSLQRNVPLKLERSLFLFGTDGDSNLNPSYVFFRAELGIGQPPTDSISLPLMIAIGVGFGLPVVGLVLGFVGMCLFVAYKCSFRLRKKTSRYVMIN